MELSLPVEVRAALTDAGLSDDEVLVKTGDELREAIGDQLTYELVAALNGQDLTIARWPGRPGSLPEPGLVQRNLRILELRVVEHMNFAQIGREVGLTNSRVSEILRTRFGIGVPDRPVLPTLNVSAADMPTLREAVLGRLDGVTEDLLATIRTGGDVDAALSAWDTVRWLWREVQKDQDAELSAGSDRGPQIEQALRDHAEVKRDEGDQDGAAVCDRLLAAMP